MTVVICYLLLFFQMLFKLIFSQFSFFNLTVISFPSLLGFYCSHLNISWKKETFVIGSLKNILRGHQ